MKRPTSTSVAHWGRRQVALLVGVVVTAGFLIVAALAIAGQPRQLKYEPWVASSAEESGCLGKRGIYVQLTATVKPRVNPSEGKKLAAKSRPAAVQLRVGSRSYNLTIDKNSPLVGNGQVAWGFKPLSIDKKRATALVGKRATLSYRIGKSDSTLKRSVKVIDGACRAPF